MGVIQFVIVGAVLCFWIWMLVDCLQNQSFQGNDKLIWIVVLVFLNVLGAALYYFLVKSKTGSISN